MSDEQSETPCHHGWRGTRIAEQIADRCPSCGGKTLFIGSGGWLTCSYLRCSEPGVGRAIEKLRAEVAELREDRARLDWLTRKQDGCTDVAGRWSAVWRAWDGEGDIRDAFDAVRKEASDGE